MNPLPTKRPWRRPPQANPEIETLLDRIADGDMTVSPTLPQEQQEALQAALWLAAQRRTWEAQSTPTRRPSPTLALLRQRRGRRPWLHRRWGDIAWWQHPVVHLILVLLLVLNGFSSLNRLTLASQAWLPGDLFYPLKTLGEELALLAAPSRSQAVYLHTRYAQRRLLEAQALILENDYRALPALSANYERHLFAALQGLQELASRDPHQARRLALDLQSVLLAQLEFMDLLDHLTPSAQENSLHHLLALSQETITALQVFLHHQGTFSSPTLQFCQEDGPMSNKNILLSFSFLKGSLRTVPGMVSYE